MLKRKLRLILSMTTILATAVLGEAVAQNGVPPMPPFAQNAASLTETARADAIIAKDPKNLSDIGMLCKPPREIFAKGLSYNTPSFTKAFDNLYYVGLGGVGAWAISTNRGIILLDALDSPEEAQKYIEGGLRTAGLDPAQIKYVIVSHGHADHYGGAKYLQDKFGARVLMSPADWALTASTPPGPQAPIGPKHDLDIYDGQKLTLGDTSVVLYITPGHTAGTVSAIFPVIDHNKSRMISFWGGTLFSSDPSLLTKYAASIRRFVPIAKAAGVEGIISNHPVFDDAVGKLGEMAASPNTPNPFIIGQDGVSRYYKILSHCLKAQIYRQSPAPRAL